MANIIELFALVEMTGPAIPKPHPAMNALAPNPPEPTIKRIVRTYEGQERAQVDMDLLEEAVEAHFAIIKTTHIES